MNKLQLYFQTLTNIKYINYEGKFNYIQNYERKFYLYIKV